ncbi:jg22805 [Pararge aegeria aegeria]|uniref:Jg22805 protein n=1 Tax=Pararge aegeria aegeria TaxID=348720 RepID=A0A8S4S2A3_9NEOP|nr:jg22805 [Pararge aegeria aegeria]
MRRHQADDPFASSSPRVQTLPGRAPFRSSPTSPRYAVKLIRHWWAAVVNGMCVMKRPKNQCWTTNEESVPPALYIRRVLSERGGRLAAL